MLQNLAAYRVYDPVPEVCCMVVGAAYWLPMPIKVHTYPGSGCHRYHLKQTLFNQRKEQQ